MYTTSPLPNGSPSFPDWPTRAPHCGGSIANFSQFRPVIISIHLYYLGFKWSLNETRLHFMNDSLSKKNWLYLHYKTIIVQLLSFQKLEFSDKEQYLVKNLHFKNFPWLFWFASLSVSMMNSRPKRLIVCN